MKGKPLQYSAAAQSRYQRDMSQLIKGMIADYEKTFSSLHEDFDGVTTYSTGTEPNRRVVVSCER